MLREGREEQDNTASKNRSEQTTTTTKEKKETKAAPKLELGDAPTERSELLLLG
jgi:hypothetical protein